MASSSPDGTTPPGAQSTLAQRLQWLVDQRFGGVAGRMADAVGAPRSSFHSYLTGRFKPAFEQLREIGEKSGADFNWIITGTGAPFPHEARAEVSMAEHVETQRELIHAQRRELAQLRERPNGLPAGWTVSTVRGWERLPSDVRRDLIGQIEQAAEDARPNTVTSEGS